ncbi:hypothetical protein [Gordonia sihwensis]|uniref:hypothetical protein n=1 Tax=Gordonia sihwensis TaxID=173559 RepID=UPI003D97B17F
MRTYQFVVHIFNVASEDQATRVMAERFEVEEDYGFDYTVTYYVKPEETSGSYDFTVDVDGVVNEEQAVQVMQERTMYEADYGFEYGINYGRKSVRS